MGVRKTSASKSTMEKQSKSTGVASTVVQSKDQSAAISAVNTDKFASSLRESSGVQIGTQKDVSVIDAHRRQSQVNSYQSQQQYQQQSQQQYHQQQQYSNNMFGGYQQQQQSSTWSQASQQQQRQYQQQFQQQRQQQQKMAWQEQQSSTYSASRRKTWAESSVFHGGIAFAGSSGSGYHEHSCPASGLHSATVTKETPYKFERQTATGHRLFLPTISN